jgi:uncharacterized protein YjaZ
MLQLDFFETVTRPSDAETNGPLRTMLERSLRRAQREIVPMLPLALRIVVSAGADPSRVVPETGVAARAWAEDRIDLWVDPNNCWVQAAGEEEVVAMMAHELHHCARWRRPGYGRTLAEAIVSEGLACHFESRFRGGIPPFWARALDDATMAAVHDRAIGELESRQFCHRAWFGSAAGGDEGRGPGTDRTDPRSGNQWPVPRHAGHALGYRIVARHLRRTGRSAAELVGEPAQAFFD